MRIVSGNLKGRKFKSALPDGIRPTQDAVRETIFNILGNFTDIEGKVIADICAGTGALGFEALSRGAKAVYFIEKNRKIAEFIERAAADFNLPEDSFSIIQHDALKVLKKMNDFIPGIKFDLAFIDPPYKLRLGNGIAGLLDSENLMNSDGIVVLESDSFENMIVPAGFEILTERKFGETKITLSRKKYV